GPRPEVPAAILARQAGSSQKGAQDRVFRCGDSRPRGDTPLVDAPDKRGGLQHLFDQGQARGGRAGGSPSDLPLRPALLYVDLHGELGRRLRYSIILDSPVPRRKCDAAGCIYLRGEADNASTARYLLLPVRGMR